MHAPDITIDRVFQDRMLSCGPGIPVAEAAESMAAARCSCILVIENGDLAGIWTERDALDVDVRDPRALAAPIATVMRGPVKTINHRATLGDATIRLKKEGVRHLVVKGGDGVALGVLTQSDIALHAGIHRYLAQRSVRSVLTRALMTLGGDARITEAMRLMRRQGLDAVAIAADDAGGGYGLLTESDLVRHLGRQLDQDAGDGPVEPLASRPLLCVDADRSLYGAKRLMEERQVRHLGVTDGTGALIGLLSCTDILSAVEHGYAEELGSLLRARNAPGHHRAPAGPTGQRWIQDGLTGLPNRCQFIRALPGAIEQARRNGTSPAVAIVGLDRFRKFNDSFGLTLGDEVLRMAAHRIAETVPQNAMLARLVGDEFALFLPEADDTAALGLLATTLLDVLAQPMRVNGHELFVTASVGVRMPGWHEAADAETLLHLTGAALQLAKQAGGNTFRLPTVSQDRRARCNGSIEADLLHALEREELRVHYQPKVDLASMSVVGMEALVRWLHPERGMVPPDQFIQVAEDCGLIEPIGNWVLETACTQTRRWIELGFGDLQVAVNISARQFLDSHFDRKVRRAVERSGLAPHHLELELTESVALGDTEASIRTMRALSTMGLSLAIDDFGTGYSSLSYIQRLPVHTVKIDRCFIKDLGVTGNAIPRAIITMAHHLGMKVVAEGIETYTHLDMLQFDGCDQGQGFYFSKPLAANDFAAFCGSPRKPEGADWQGGHRSSEAP